eukprot:4187826-Prymnesium_polylepis.1
MSPLRLLRPARSQRGSRCQCSAVHGAVRRWPLHHAASAAPHPEVQGRGGRHRALRLRRETHHLVERARAEQLGPERVGGHLGAERHLNAVVVLQVGVLPRASTWGSISTDLDDAKSISRRAGIVLTSRANGRCVLASEPRTSRKSVVSARERIGDGNEPSDADRLPTLESLTTSGLHRPSQLSDLCNAALLDAPAPSSASAPFELVARVQSRESRVCFRSLGLRRSLRLLLGFPGSTLGGFP